MNHTPSFSRSPRPPSSARPSSGATGNSSAARRRVEHVRRVPNDHEQSLPMFREAVPRRFGTPDVEPGRVVRAPTGSLLRRFPHLRWEPVASRMAGDDTETTEATAAALEGVYPVAATPRSGRFSPNGGFYTDATVDDEVAVRPAMTRSDVEARAPQDNYALAIRHALRMLHTRGGLSRGEDDLLADLDASRHGIPEWLAAASSHAADVDGDADFDGATLAVWIDVHASAGMTAAATDTSNHATRALLKRFCTTIPEGQTKLVATFQRLWADKHTLFDARLQFFYARSRDAIRDATRSILRSALASGAGIGRHGDDGRWLVCEAPVETAAFVYAFMATHLQKVSPILATDAGLFIGKGRGNKALPNASATLALSSGSAGTSRPRSATTGASDELGAWWVDGMVASVASRSGRRRSSARSVAAAPPVDSLRHAVRHRTRCFTAPKLPWFCSRDPPKPFARCSGGAVGDLRRRREEAEARIAQERAAAAAAEESARYDFEGKRADLSKFDMPDTPDWSFLPEGPLFPD